MRASIWKALIPPAALPLGLWLVVAAAGPGGPLEAGRTDGDPAAAASAVRADGDVGAAYRGQTTFAFRGDGAVTPAEGVVGSGQRVTSAPTATEVSVPAEGPAAAEPPSPGAPSDSPAPSGQTSAPTAAPSATAVSSNVEECDESDEFRMEVDDDGEVEVRGGIVSSFSGNTLVVESPDGPLTVVLTAETDVEGDLSAATEVRVKGVRQDDGSIVAEEVKVRCPETEEDG